jgi:hypothetical protein
MVKTWSSEATSNVWLSFFFTPVNVDKIVDKVEEGTFLTICLNNFSS